MTSVVDTFRKERLEAKKAQLAAYSDAITALNAGVESYLIDTGQTKQTVTRSNVLELQRVIETLEGEIVVLMNALYGNGGVVYGRPVT